MLDLSEETRRALLGFTVTPGYGAVLDVMEQLLTVGETEHFRLDRRKPYVKDEQILSSQDQARARREFFEEVQMEVTAQIEKFQPPKEAAEAGEEEHGGEGVSQSN